MLERFSRDHSADQQETPELRLCEARIIAAAIVDENLPGHRYVM
jgi:hypothetical protein